MKANGLEMAKLLSKQFIQEIQEPPEATRSHPR
jgi:hypothetical protein